MTTRKTQTLTPAELGRKHAAELLSQRDWTDAVRRAGSAEVFASGHATGDEQIAIEDGLLEETEDATRAYPGVLPRLPRGGRRGALGRRASRRLTDWPRPA